MKTKVSASWLACLSGLCLGIARPTMGAGEMPGDSPVSIIVPARMLSAEIRIESDSQDWQSRLGKIDEARQFIKNAAESAGFSVRIEQPLIGHHPKFSGFSAPSQRAPGPNSADMVVSCALDSKSDLIRIVQQIEGILSRLSVEDRGFVSIGRIYLTIDNPESLRSELLRQIRVYVEGTAKALSDSAGYSITGLEQPVQVRPWGEHDVEAFIPFSVTYGQPKTG